MEPEYKSKSNPGIRRLTRGNIIKIESQDLENVLSQSAVTSSFKTDLYDDEVSNESKNDIVDTYHVSSGLPLANSKSKPTVVRHHNF